MSLPEVHHAAVRHAGFRPFDTVKLAQQVLSAAHAQKAAAAEPAPAESTVEDEMPDRAAVGRPLHLVA